MEQHTGDFITSSINVKVQLMDRIGAQECPASSHMGGVWERQIRLARTILMSLLHTHGRSLNDESLRTLLTETEAIVNSRPLTVDTLGDVQSEQAICPSNILIMKSKVVLSPPDHFVKADEYSRRRWRHIQYIANEFWVRWRKEFLWSLQSRHKWTHFDTLLIAYLYHVQQ